MVEGLNNCPPFTLCWRKFPLVYHLYRKMVTTFLSSHLQITSTPAWCLAAVSIEGLVDSCSSLCLTRNSNLALARQAKNNVAYISRDYSCDITQHKVVSHRKRKKNLNFSLVRLPKTSHLDNKEETLVNRLSLAEWQTQPWQNKSERQRRQRHHLLEVTQTKQSRYPPPHTHIPKTQHPWMGPTAQCRWALFHRRADTLPSWVAGTWCCSWIWWFPGVIAEVRQ